MLVRHLVLVLLSLGGVAAVAGAAADAPAPAAQAEFRAAVEALRAGDWESAIRGFGLAADRTWLLSDYAQLFLADSLSRAGDLNRARRVAEVLARSGPPSRLEPAALLLAAYLAGRAGDEASAERWLGEFVARHQRHPEAPAARYLLALSLEAQGRSAEAAAVLRELWRVAPATAYGEAAAERLDLLAQGGVVVPPPTEEARLDRAERLLSDGAPALAREEAEVLLTEGLGPERALRALAVMAQSSRRLGRYGDAARAVERSLSLVPPARHQPLLLELGRLQHRAGARELALSTLDRVVQKFAKEPEAAAALVERGRILQETGRVQEAACAYGRAAGEFPDQTTAEEARWRLGWIAYLNGDVRGAAGEFARLAERRSPHGYRHAAAYWAGRSYDAAGEQGHAQSLFGMILDEAPRSYYGILAARRAGVVRAHRSRPLPVKLPVDPLAPLAADIHFARSEALRGVDLAEEANAEMEELLATSQAEPAKLYALSALWTREGAYHRALRIVRRYFADLAATGNPGLPRQFWEAVYPVGWKRELREASARVGLDFHLVAAVVREESSFFPRARSRVGARGLMQLMPETARPLAQRRGLVFGAGEILDDPGVNLRLGAEFLAKLLRDFGDFRLALAAYNAGPVRVREWWGARRTPDLEVFVEQIPFDETRHFVKRVLVSWAEYRRIYGAEG